MKSFALFFLLLPAIVFAQKPYYVHAPSGLNMRATSDPGSQKITTVPYGAQLDSYEAPAKMDMSIDNLTGGMAKVSYKGKTGYMFSGYLSMLPGTKKQMGTELYVDLLRRAGISYLYSNCREDYDGVYSVEEAFRVPKDSWQEVFLVCKVMYNLPEVFKFPGLQGVAGQKTYPNTDVAEYVYSEEMVVTRNIKGRLEQIAYYRGQEGSGTSLIISVEGEEMDFLRVSYSQTAD